MRKKNLIYFNLYLIIIFYKRLPEKGGSFVVIRSHILGEPMLNMYIWMSGVGGEKIILSHSAFFMWRVCKDKM